MKNDQQKDKIARRDFLRTAGVGAAAAAVATTAMPARSKLPKMPKPARSSATRKPNT